jgi:isochorismate synthase
VVLARFVDAELDSPVDPLAALSFLRADNVRAHVFHFELSPGRVFLGAAPEILAKLRGGRFEATAVAGSMPRAREREEDEALALRLLRSEKNLAEHGLTLEEMLEGLEGRLVGMGVDPEPRVLRLAGIQHLETVIRGSAAAGEDILSLVEALHPTPAVCGRPRAEALRVLAEEEPFDRGWFAGPVGWFDASGEGNFVPALRSAVGEGRDWRLFAGAGIVTGSEADEEWQETELKLEPALRALRAGAGPAPL